MLVFNQLTDHRVIIDRNFVAFVYIAVDTYTDTVRFHQLTDDTRRRHEVVFRIFGTDTAFDSMTTLFQLFLLEVQRFATGYTQLFLHQIHSNYFFRNRMFYLQTGIHFQEIEVTVLVYQEFNGTSPLIVHCLGSSHCRFTHLLTQFRSHERRRSLFHNFLVTTLNRTFTLEQMNSVSVVVAQNLELDVMRFFHKFLQINRIISKRRHRFRTCRIVCFLHFIYGMNQTHTFTATTHGSLQHYRITDAVTDFLGLFYTLQRLLCTRNYRNTGRNHVLTCRDFVTHSIHGLRIRTDENDALFPATTCKLRIF